MKRSVIREIPCKRTLRPRIALRSIRATNLDRHCDPPGRREAPTDDRLREAIHLSACGAMDCFVAIAPRNDGSNPSLDLARFFRQHDRDAVADRISELCG